MGACNPMMFGSKIKRNAHMLITAQQHPRKGGRA